MCMCVIVDSFYRLFIFTLDSGVTLCLCGHVLCGWQEGGFERKSTTPVDHFDGEYPKELIIGTCNHCKKTDVLVGGLLHHLLLHLSLSHHPSAQHQLPVCVL